MRRPTVLALLVALANACSEGSETNDDALGGSAGARAGGPNSGGGGQNTAGEPGGSDDGGDAGAPSGAGGAAGVAGAAGASAEGGSSPSAGAPGQGGGGPSADACEACDSGQVCIYQVGGPGPSRYLCATETPCAAPAACACIVDQGQCSFSPDPSTNGSGICFCDNGLD